VSGKTALFFALSVYITELLIKFNADVNAKDNEGFTAAMWSHLNGMKIVSKFLIEKGADFHGNLMKKRVPLSHIICGENNNYIN